MTINDRLAVTPEFSPLDGNERARFYFENRELIETWAALRVDASRAIEERLPELADNLSDDLAEGGVDDAVVQLETHRAVASIHLARMGWTRGSNGSPVRIVVETGDRSILDSKGFVHLYTGVRVKQSHPSAPQFAESLAALCGLRSALEGKWKQTQPRWPLWRYALTDGDWTLDGLLQTVRVDALNLWSVIAPRVDEILDASSTPS